MILVFALGESNALFLTLNLHGGIVAPETKKPPGEAVFSRVQ